MFKNKHMILALLVAPMLAIIAWLSVDYFVAEKPHVAKPGASYVLVARPNCRRASGRCELVNKDVEVSVVVPSYDATSFNVELNLTIAAERVAIGLAGGTPTALAALGGQGRRWAGPVAGSVKPDSLLRLALVANESTFYAEIPVVFFFAELKYR